MSYITLSEQISKYNKTNLSFNIKSLQSLSVSLSLYVIFISLLSHKSLEINMHKHQIITGLFCMCSFI